MTKTKRLITILSALCLVGFILAVPVSANHDSFHAACKRMYSTLHTISHSSIKPSTKVAQIETSLHNADANECNSEPVVTPPPPPPPPPPPAGIPLCFGDPTGPVAGWPTSNGYSKQYPFGHPERVSFDDSVSVMQSVGCRTVRAELQTGDLDTNGGTVNLRAQLYKDPNQATYDEQGSNPGQTAWYGLAFTTNPGYVPQADPNFPNWNVIFTWHSTIEGAGNPISMVIATKAISTVDCGGSYVPFSDGQPHLMLEVNGGDPAKWPTGGATCKRVPGPAFVPGHLYRIEHKVTWSDNFAGAVEWWVDGVQYANLTGISNMTLGGRVWALWENYRPYAASFPTADIYYGGLIKGDSRAAVIVP